MLVDATSFSAVGMVELLIRTSVWESIIIIRETVYTCLPCILMFDNGSQFRDTYLKIFEMHDFERQILGA